jgi:hypothetical protein
MGDSTFNTEHFLIQTYGDLIKDVELLHIPHHASYLTSSSYPGHPERPNVQVNFVAKANPRYAVLTAAYNSGAQLGLPRQETVDRYHSGARLLSKADHIEDNFKVIACYQKQISVTTVKVDEHGRPIKTSKVEENVPVEYPATKEIWCTGSHGAIDFDYEQRPDRTVEKI